MISAHVNEEGTIEFTVTPVDGNGDDLEIGQLTSANWQLSDYSGNIINDMTFDNGLITANPVILTCKDLEIGSYGVYRIFAVKATYDSSSGSDLCAKEEFRFKINDLVNFA